MIRRFFVHLFLSVFVSGLPASCPSVPLPPPPPLGGGSASGAGGDAVVGVLPSAGPQPVTGGGGGGGCCCRAILEWGEGGAEVLLLGTRSGSGGSGVGMGGGFSDCGPPSASLATLWCFRLRWAPSVGPAPMLASSPCPTLSGRRAPGLPATVPAACPGPPAHAAAAASHACLWPQAWRGQLRGNLDFVSSPLLVLAVVFSLEVMRYIAQ